MKRITSAENPRFRFLRQLAESSRERKKAGLSVLDGAHLVTAYRDRVGAPEQLVVSDSGLKNPEVAAIVESLARVEPLLLADGLFRQISPVVTPTGILAVVRTPRPAPVPEEMGACVMLEDLQDPGNLGSILRSAAAAGVKHVALSRGSVHAWSPRVLRAGMGAHFLLGVYEGVDLPAAVRAFRGRVIATSRAAPRTVYETDLAGNVALLFGNEGSGLSRELKGAAHAAVSVPMAGGVESLNVAAAVAVCLFERVRQLAANSVIRES